MLSHLSEQARREIISKLSVSSTEPGRDPLAHPPPQNMHRFGMWKSFLTTVGLSIASNICLYFLSVGMRLLEQSEPSEQSEVRSEPLSALTEQDEWNKWVLKFLGWMAERVAAPVLLTWLLLLIRASVVDNEKYMMEFDNNETVNVLVNGMSRAFFLGIRDFPGLSHPNLWARLASVVIDIIGAAFLWWMGGHWDPDIAVWKLDFGILDGSAVVVVGPSAQGGSLYYCLRISTLPLDVLPSLPRSVMMYLFAVPVVCWVVRVLG